MTAAEATPELDAPAHDRAFLGHPKGLGYLAFVEGCERFSYYSMQTLLVLYMVKYLLLPEHIGNVLGLQWLQAAAYGGKEGQPLASAIFGDYTSLAYLTPIVGSFIADRSAGPAPRCWQKYPKTSDNAQRAAKALGKQKNVDKSKLLKFPNAPQM